MPQKSGQDFPRELTSEGIYCEAKRIQWAISPGLDKVIVRHEWFHRAKNVLSLMASA